MVGVAGQSKGCVTCRRRRLGCDQQRPQCQRCLRGGRLCEGYQRFPVFINDAGSNRYRRHAALESDNVTTQPDPLDVPHFESPAIYDQRLAAALLDVYRPPNNNHWLYGAVAELRSFNTLRLSLRCLSLSRLGFANKDPALVYCGVYTYGKALRSLQHAVHDPVMRVHVGTLSAIRVLSLYEAFNQHELPTHGWNSHDNGIIAVIAVSGRLSSQLARSIYRETRRASILSSFLTTSEAITLEPDPTIRADPISDRLWNLALDLSKLNHRVYEVLNVSAETLNSNGLCTLLQQYLTLDKRFKRWEDMIQSKNPFTTVSSSTAIDLGTRYIFSSESLGYAWIYCWGFRLLLADLVLHLVDQLPNDIGLDVRYISHLNLPIDLTSPPYLASLRDHFSHARHKYATNIMHASHFALTPAAGHYGAYRLSFGALLALYAFQKSSHLVGLAAASEIVRMLAEDKGLNIASAVRGKLAQMMDRGYMSAPLLQRVGSLVQILEYSSQH